MKRVQKVLGAALLLGVGLLAGTLTGQGAVYVADTPYDWEAYADDTDPYTSRDSDWVQTGPGAVIQEEETIEGPSVTQVTLGERYHEEYKIYEESMGGFFFFYTNVPNGGITDKAVVLDIPQNMFCTVEKDGAPFSYIPGQAISGYGTYVVRLTAVEDMTLPFSEQKEYRALYRFRIQPKPPAETEAGVGESLPPGGGYDASYTQGRDGVNFPPAGEGAETTQDSAESPWEAAGEGETLEAAAGEEQAGAEAGQSPAGEEQNGAGTGQSPAGEEQNGAGTGQNPAGEEQAPTGENQESEAANKEEAGGPGTYRERSQVYNAAAGTYEVTFEGGEALRANVPEGYIGPGPVHVQVPEGEASLYRNDEPLEYTGDASLTETGYYRLEAGGQTWSFTIALAVNSLEYYPAPAGMTVTHVSLNGEQAEGYTDRYVSMKEDGQYQISMTGREGEKTEVTLRKDTKAPELAVTVKGGKAQIQYLSDDIASIELEKNGRIQPGFSGYSVNSPGSYLLTATDEAGNVSSAAFTLRYQVNRYGIAAVILCILLIAGGAGFVIHVKRTVKIR